MAWSPKYLVAACAVVVIVVAAAWGTTAETKIYTCNHTYSRKRVDTGSWCFIPRRPTETIQPGPYESPTALHDWWLQSTVQSLGPGGLFGSRVKTERFEFRDGSRPEHVASTSR